MVNRFDGQEIAEAEFTASATGCNRKVWHDPKVSEIDYSLTEGPFGGDADGMGQGS